jgi:hypothetical protein
MQPAGQHRTIRQLPGLPGESHKHRLRYILGQVHIANHAPRGRIDEVKVPPHQFGECRL